MSELVPTVYTVLLYPPRGTPRVVSLPKLDGFQYPCKVFATESEASAALEAFLVENPEYRRWKDGSLQEARP